MTWDNEERKYFRRVRRYALVLALVWTTAACMSMVWNLWQEKSAVLERARAEVRGSSDKDLLLQQWIAGHGGIYVPVDEETPPNPYLSHVEERDVETPSGRRLTLMNAAYATRQLYAPSQKSHEVRGHFTSLNPIRKGNAPDSWEKSALEAFERGEGEITEVALLDGEPYMRLMRPMAVVERCLKCHGHQGYKVGDNRGGSSVSVPMAPHVTASQGNMITMTLAHGFLWLLGLGGIGIGVWRVQSHVRERDRAEETQQLSYRFLQILNQHTEMKPLLQEFTEELQRVTNCDAIGVRILDKDGNIPYESYVGFSKEFYEFESPLSVKSDQCMCINVIEGDFDPTLPFYTEKGSFYMNGTTRFLATVSEEAKGSTRNVCNQSGYESVALLPIQMGNRILGLIHIADSRENMVPPERIKMLETVAMQLGSAIVRTQAGEGLRESEERYREFVEGAEDLVTRVDGERRFLFVNKTAERVFGLKPEECIGLSVFDFIHADDRENTRERLSQYIRDRASTGTFENRQVSRTGEVSHMIWISQFHYDAQGELISIDGTARDITERKKMQRQIEHTQKLESLGVLAGGIAHDFNNLLTSILGNADLAAMNLSPVSPARQNLEEIEKASRRAADLCRQMLAYSGKGAFVIRSINLNELVREMAHLLEASLSKKAILRYELADDLPPIEADPTQIHQITMNLITNASESLGEDTGLIGIATGTMDCNEEYLQDASLGEELPEGRYVYFQVSDTGCGMDAETLAKVFDPFFTTKFTGRGLGLAAVIGITRAQKGAIKINSAPGKGTTFRILFPSCEKPAEESKSDTEMAQDWRGSGTVLLVDDEAMVRQVAASMLKNIGFDVLEAADGHEAVEIFRAQKDEIILVLLDMSMPRMGGEEAFNEIKGIKSDARVVLSSGYTEQEALNGFEGKGLAGFVQKPYKYENLLEKIRNALND